MPRRQFFVAYLFNYLVMFWGLPFRSVPDLCLTPPAPPGITEQTFSPSSTVWKFMLKQLLLRIILALPLVLCSQPLRADDNVLSTIKEAARQYEAGDYTGAASNLDYAAQLVRQQKSERMKSLLPAPLSGWEGKEASAQALGAAILGGGVTVSRDYKKGNSSISVEIVSDSPVLQSVLMMVNNPMFAGAGGGKLETLKGQRAISKYDSSKKTGELYIVVASRFVVTIKGRQVAREDLLAYGEAIDYQALEKH
jgi:hypothetical protein